MMLTEANVIMLDEPTNHLDLESISSLNEAIIKYREVVLFSSHDHQFVNTVANRIIEIIPNGLIDRVATFDEFLENPGVQKLRDELYHEHHELEI